MPCSDLTLRYTAGDCNEDNTRTYTITIENPSPVEPIEFYIDFENDGTYDVGPETLTAGGTAGDSYTTTHDYMSGMTHRLLIHFIMPDGTECDDYRDIAVESCCCLEITEIDVDDDCDTEDCTRDVEIEVENCGTADATVTQIDWGDGAIESLPSADNPNPTIAAGSDEEFVHAYDASTAGTYNATITLDECDDLVSDDIVIDECDCDGSDEDCPTVTIAWGSESHCDENCEKSIDVTVNVTADASLSYEIEFTLGSSTYTLADTGTQSFGPYTLTGAPGDSVTAVAEVVSPEGCDGSHYPSSYTFSDCDCPNVDIDFEEGDCQGDEREVTVSATVDGECGSETISARLLVDGAEVDSASASGSVTLEDTDWYTIGDTITAQVEITSPEDCDGESKDYTVTDCDDTTTTTTTTEEDTCETNPVCCWLCWLVTIFGSIFAFSGAASLAGAFLPYSPYVAAVVGFLWVFFLIWAYLQCDECYITECVLKGFALAFLVTLVLLILSALGLFTVATAAQLAWMLLIIGVVTASFYALYRANCT